MTTHHRHQALVLATAALVLLVRAELMLVVAAGVLLTTLALQVRVHPHHHERHA